MIGAGCPVFGVLQPVGTVDEVQQTRPFRTERAAVDRVVSVTLDVNDRTLGIAGAVAQRIHQNAATHRTVRAGLTGHRGLGQLELANFGQRLRGREAHQSHAGRSETGPRHLEELSPGDLLLHGTTFLVWTRPRATRRTRVLTRYSSGAAQGLVRGKKSKPAPSAAGSTTIRTESSRHGPGIKMNAPAHPASCASGNPAIHEDDSSSQCPKTQSVRRMNRPTVDGMCLKARAFVRNRQTIPRMLRSERDCIAVRLM